MRHRSEPRRRRCTTPRTCVGGLLQTRGRAGSYVHTLDLAHAQAEAAARTYAQAMRTTGLTIEEAIRLFRTVAASDT